MRTSFITDEGYVPDVLDETFVVLTRLIFERAIRASLRVSESDATIMSSVADIHCCRRG